MELTKDKAVQFVSDTLTTEGGEGELKIIGKPHKYNDLVDPKQRISEYIKTKMNIIDLIPCDYQVGVDKKVTSGESGSENQIENLEQIKHRLKYPTAIKNYQKLCTNYSLKSYAGLRLYTTDETTATDEFRNSFSENFLQSSVNNVSSIGRQAKSLAKSLGGEGLITGIKDTALGALDAGISMLTSDTDTKSKLMDVSSSIADVLIGGNAISLPKIWDNSNYQPSSTIVISLVSPYGSNKAIREFIIKPLTYLILMSLPKTNDGISFGFPQMLTMRAYGISEVSLASIASLTMNRGGNDTAFNKDRQPLSVNVSMQIANLIDGSASYFSNLPAFESGAIGKCTNDQNSGNIYEQSGDTLFQTPGKIIKSLSPFKQGKMDINMMGLTGNFEKSADPLNDKKKTNTINPQSNNPNNSNNPNSSNMYDSVDSLIAGLQNETEFSSAYNKAKQSSHDIRKQSKQNDNNNVIDSVKDITLKRSRQIIDDIDKKVIGNLTDFSIEQIILDPDNNLNNKIIKSTPLTDLKQYEQLPSDGDITQTISDIGIDSFKDNIKELPIVIALDIKDRISVPSIEKFDEPFMKNISNVVSEVLDDQLNTHLTSKFMDVGNQVFNNVDQKLKQITAELPSKDLQAIVDHSNIPLDVLENFDRQKIQSNIENYNQQYQNIKKMPNLHKQLSGAAVKNIINTVDVKPKIEKETQEHLNNLINSAVIKSKILGSTNFI